MTEESITVGFALYRLGSGHSIENISVAQQWIYVNYIENTSCETGSFVAYVYCEWCFEIGLLYCWLFVAGLFTKVFPSNGSTCYSMINKEMTVE
jgi:hypothetical protein